MRRMTWRRQILNTLGVRLLQTRRCRPAKHRRGTRLDLIAYCEPGGPRRPSYFVLTWNRERLIEDSEWYTRGEAQEQFRTGGRRPSWWRTPPPLREIGGDHAEVPHVG